MTSEEWLVSRDDVKRWCSGLFAGTLLVFLAVWYCKRRKMVRLIEKLPGPPALPIIGNALDVNIDIVDLFPLGMLVVKEYGPIMRAWLGPVPIVVISGARQAETILCSTRHINKPVQYSFFHPWLGNTGLLVADAHIWHGRRRLLTPAFHLKILEQFVEVFSKQSLKMADKMRPLAGGQLFDIFPFITNCTLDAICETIMGTCVDAQDNPNSEYVEAVHKIHGLIQQRMLIIWQHPDLMFRLLGYAKQQTQLLTTLHSFTRAIVKTRRQMYERQRNGGGQEQGKRPRLAFLDLLLEYSDEGRVLTDEDIREEVDLFVFAGHDTTAVAMNWCLYLLGAHKDIQARVHEELDAIFGNSDRTATMEDVREMRYTENCIKEALRLFPSAPYLGRQLTQEVTIDGYTIPSGTTIMILTYALHRDPEQFPDPETFDPERFQPDIANGRHPFAFIPFSAGPRNCIGQKFGMLELKVMVSNFLRQYRIESDMPREDIKFRSEIVLRPNDGNFVRIYHRDDQKNPRGDDDDDTIVTSKCDESGDNNSCSGVCSSSPSEDGSDVRRRT